MAAPGKGDLSADCGGGIEGIPPGDLPVDVLLDDSQDIHAWRESRQSGQAEADGLEQGTVQTGTAQKKRVAALLVLVLAIGIGVGIIIGAITLPKKETKNFVPIDDIEQERPLDNKMGKFSFD